MTERRWRLGVLWALPMLREARRMLSSESAYNPDPLIEQIGRFEKAYAGAGLPQNDPQNERRVSVLIVSDGTPWGTRVLTESGEEIRGVSRIEWSVDANDRGMAQAVIHLRRVPVEVSGEAVL